MVVVVAMATTYGRRRHGLSGHRPRERVHGRLVIDDRVAWVDGRRRRVGSELILLRTEVVVGIRLVAVVLVHGSGVGRGYTHARRVSRRDGLREARKSDGGRMVDAA